MDPRSHLTEESELVTEDNARRLVAQWSSHWDLDRRLLLEKSPPNLVRTRFLQALFPGARFVVVVRHPVVVALSTQKWAGPLAGLAPLLEHWIRAHEAFLADVEHLRNVHVVNCRTTGRRPRCHPGRRCRLPRAVSDHRAWRARRAPGQRLRQPLDGAHPLAFAPDPATRRAPAPALRRPGLLAFGYDFDDLERVEDFPAGRTDPGVPQAPLRVLYVGGMPRSGSTLTDLMLHQLPDTSGSASCSTSGATD